MDRWTKNLSVLQDFVPYQGRCPAIAQLQPKNCIKQGKGTADHMMPLGNWFIIGVLIQMQNDLSIHTYIPPRLFLGSQASSQGPWPYSIDHLAQALVV